MRCTIATCLPFLDRGRPLAIDDKLLAAALTAQGVEVNVVAWEDQQHPWTHADLVINRSTWNYYYHYEAYLRWARHVALSSALLNPLSILEWNTDKRTYLQDLAVAGFPVIPCLWLEQGVFYDLAQLLEEQGWSQAVIKPCVGANSYGARFVALETLDAQSRWICPSRSMMLQPFVTTIATCPERSHVFINHAWSHSFEKADAFRARLEAVTTELVTPPTEDVALAERLMRFVGHRFGPLLYGRVDLVRDECGALQVMELELTEPMLHLEYAEALSRLSTAICNRFARQRAM